MLPHSNSTARKSCFLSGKLTRPGLSLGMALAGALFSERQAFYATGLGCRGFAPAEAFRQAIVPAFHDVLMISVILGGAATVLAFLSLFGKQGRANAAP